MSKKNGSGLEKYIDKIVLGVVGLIALYVLFFYVLTSPNTVEYNGAKYGPANLDKVVREQARLVEEKLGGKEIAEKSYQPKLQEFKSILAAPLKGIDDKAYISIPYVGAGVIGERVWEIPKICDVNNIKARLLTAVAYVPKKPLENDDSYASAETEQADLDFVTVQATIDAAELSKRFAQSFGAAKNPVWVKPVFSVVQLERQELLKSGNWTDWQSVPRIKVDEFRNRFNIPEKVDKLDKSIKILMLQFDRADVKAELLQPSTYDFAYPVESWLPPALGEKRQVKLDKARTEEQRRLKEDAAKRAEDERNRNRGTRSTTTAPVTTRPAGGGGAGMTAGRGGGGMGMPGGGMGIPGGGMAMPAAPVVARPAAPGRTQPANRSTAIQPDAGSRTAHGTKPSTVVDPLAEEQEFAKIRITEKTDFAAMKEPLLLWAHDDTAQPGETYRYRLRVGVFDPVAGTNSFNQRDKALKDNVILWSNYSQETSPLTIPARWYFFPRDYREADKMVTMQVCRYMLAKWYSKDNVRVKPGEVIGETADNKKNENDGDEAHDPNQIDYSNGTVLVDVVPVVEADKNYANALYTVDTKTIEHVAVKQQYWSSAMKAKFDEIEHLRKEPAPVFKQRSGERPRGVEMPTVMPRTPGMQGTQRRGMPMMPIMPEMPPMPPR